MSSRAVIAYLNDLHWNFLVYPRILASLRQKRQSLGSLLYFDIGDTLSDVMGARPVIDMMNLAGCNGWVLGNHDFDYGLPYLYEKVARASFPVVTANVIFKGDVQIPHVPFLIKNIGGLRIGFIGITTPNFPVFPAACPELFVGDPVACVRDLIPQIRNQVDALILLSHLGFEEDCLLASKIRGVDAIIGGHSHTLLEVPELVNDILICQAGGEGQYLGYLHIEGSSGSVTFKNELVRLDESLSQDDECLALLRAHQRSEHARDTEVLGTAMVSFVDEKYGRETRLGNLVCDVIRQETGADIALYNATGVNNVIPEGPIYSHDLNIAFHYDNAVYVVDVMGSQLRHIVEKALESSLDDNYYFLHSSGLRVRFSSRRSPGERVVSMTAGDAEIDPDRVYRVAVTEFLALGGHERGTQFAIFKSLQKIKAHISVRALLTRYISNLGKVSGAIEGRIMDVGGRSAAA